MCKTLLWCRHPARILSHLLCGQDACTTKVFVSPPLRLRPVSISVELDIVKTPVGAVFCEQFFERALLDDTSLVYDQDAVRPLHCGQAVGDDNGGASLDEAVERFLYQMFTFRIEA
ncbi:MAG: hypothetical protein BWY09_00755 [Candidatus Hydrogenedentes bacterium ADurb.Bin179]|nr:MAG: hypothetical protein BWY09_00755 [Candidatus Hydrogenedentes bacterium ADurb.Bin179]